MGRVVALDFGIKRTGIAVSDELKLIASGLTTVDTKNLMTFLERYCREENVSKFVIGQPLQMSGMASEIEPYIIEIVKQMAILFPQIPVSRVDERFTSKIASQTMATLGLKKTKRHNKALVDQISATIILQSYLNIPA